MRNQHLILLRTLVCDELLLSCCFQDSWTFNSLVVRCLSVTFFLPRVHCASWICKLMFVFNFRKVSAFLHLRCFLGLSLFEYQQAWWYSASLWSSADSSLFPFLSLLRMNNLYSPIFSLLILSSAYFSPLVLSNLVFQFTPF